MSGSTHQEKGSHTCYDDFTEEARNICFADVNEGVLAGKASSKDFGEAPNPVEGNASQDDDVYAEEPGMVSSRNETKEQFEVTERGDDTNKNDVNQAEARHHKEFREDEKSIDVDRSKVSDANVNQGDISCQDDICEINEQKNEVFAGKCHINHEEDLKSTMLQIQKLSVVNRSGQSVSIIGLWDAGSTICLITFRLAKKLQLHGDKVRLEIVTVGGESKQVDSQRYTVFIRDKVGKLVDIEVLGIDQISTDIELVDISGIMHQFEKSEAKNVTRPASGNIDMLIGFQYAAYHPL